MATSILAGEYLDPAYEKIEKLRELSSKQDDLDSINTRLDKAENALDCVKESVNDACKTILLIQEKDYDPHDYS